MRPDTLVLSFVLAWGCAAQAPDPELLTAMERITPEDLLGRVRFLASDELEGRYAGSAAGRRAAEYVRDAFEELGLVPLEGHDFFLPVERASFSPNVVARLPGSGPGFVLIGAHYDHLAPLEPGEEPGHGARAGHEEDRIFNGADDNASGTAALLEIAEAFRALPRPPRATVVFAAFTGEEEGLVGSRALVSDPPFDLAQLEAMVNLDMISRGREDLIFCEDGGTAAALVAACERDKEVVGLEVRYGRHPEWLPASDHHPFMQAGVPTLYLGVEDHEDYHGVGDEAERVLPGLMCRVARLAFLITAEVARDGA